MSQKSLVVVLASILAGCAAVDSTAQDESDYTVSPATPVALEQRDREILAIHNEHHCGACHAVGLKKVLGPGYATVQRYYFLDIAPSERELNATTRSVAAHIREGGSGTFGAIPMTPDLSLTPDDSEALARWILTRKELPGVGATLGENRKSSNSGGRQAP
jgi:cytochrome c551/c552